MGSEKVNSRTTSAIRQEAAITVKPTIHAEANQSARWPRSSTICSCPARGQKGDSQ